MKQAKAVTEAVQAFADDANYEHVYHQEKPSKKRASYGIEDERPSGYRMHIPDPCIVIKLDGTYDARTIRPVGTKLGDGTPLRVNARTREEALIMLDQMLNGAFV